MEVKSARPNPVQTAPTPNRAVEAAQATRRTEQAAQARNAEAAHAAQTKRNSESQPKPVVNTQGHKTGQVLNVTA